MVALKTKYKTFGFGDKAFDGVVDYLSKTVTDESQIETAIGGVEGLLKSFQLEVDFVRNEKWGLQKQLDELKAKGEAASFEEVLENVKTRDRIDSTRKESPLRQADDAVVLDNSHMTIAEQKAWLLVQYNKAAVE